MAGARVPSAGPRRRRSRVGKRAGDTASRRPVERPAGRRRSSPPPRTRRRRAQDTMPSSRRGCVACVEEATSCPCTLHRRRSSDEPPVRLHGVDESNATRPDVRKPNGDFLPGQIDTRPGTNNDSTVPHPASRRLRREGRADGPARPARRTVILTDFARIHVSRFALVHRDLKETPERQPSFRARRFCTTVADGAGSLRRGCDRRLRRADRCQ